MDLKTQEIRRTRQQGALRSSSGCWKEADHPELAHGGAAYVDEIRAEADVRCDEALKRQSI